MLTEGLLLIGKVVKPHGLKGEVKVSSFAESLETFDEAERLFLKEKDGSMKPLHIGRLASHKNMVILSFDEIEGMEAVREICGLELYIEKDTLAKLPEGEYYRYELLGLHVETIEGVPLGRVEDILPTGSNDVLLVKDGNNEHLIPVLKDVIKEVDLGKGRMVIKPLENMLDGL